MIWGYQHLRNPQIFFRWLETTRPGWRTPWNHPTAQQSLPCPSCTTLGSEDGRILKKIWKKIGNIHPLLWKKHPETATNGQKTIYSNKKIQNNWKSNTYHLAVHKKRLENGSIPRCVGNSWTCLRWCFTFSRGFHDHFSPAFGRI